MQTVTFVLGVVSGIAATATMDLAAMVLNKLGLIAGARGEWVGRWYLGILQGRFVHGDIAAYPEQKGEKQAALMGHYAIGTVLAVFYFVAADRLGIAPDSFSAALGYGFATCVFPWFLVLPALGFGVCGLKGPPELKLFRSTVMNHLSYGLGLWWTANVLPLG